MAFIVPPEQIEALRELLSRSQDEVDAFSEALANAHLHFNRFDLAREIAVETGLPRNFVEGIVAVLTSLYLTREANRTLDEFVDRTVFTSLKRAQLFDDAKDERWKRVKALLDLGLRLDKIVGTAAKSGPVLTSHERIVRGLSIMTDFRPVFHAVATEKPEVGYVVHMLHVEFRDPSQNEGDFFFAMDSNDLQLLRTVLDRALAKESALQETLSVAGIAVLRPGFTY